MILFKKSNNLFAFAVLLLFLLPASNLFSVNIYGGYITYTNTVDNKYEVKVQVIRKCTELAFNSGNSGNLELRFCNSNGGILDSFLFTNLNRTQIKDITYPSKNSVSGCGSGNKDSSGEGYELHTYAISFDFDSSIYSSAMSNSNLRYIEFGWVGPCKLNDFTNFSTQPATIYFYSRLYVYSGNILYNTSPTPTGLLNGTLCCNTRISRSYAVNDTIDFDSVHYKLVDPRIKYNHFMQYAGKNNARYFMRSYCIPNTSVSCTPNPNSKPPRGLYFDSFTGDLTFTPTKCDERGIAYFQYSEYRFYNNQWNLAGIHTLAQVLTVADDCGYNNTPIIYMPTYHKTGANTTVSISTNSTDETFSPKQTIPDTVTTQIINPVSGLKYVIVDNKAREKQATLSWTPPTKFIGYTYKIAVFANDNSPNNKRNGIDCRVATIKVNSPRCYYVIKGYHDRNQNDTFDLNDSFVGDFKITYKDSGNSQSVNPTINQVNKSYSILCKEKYFIWKLQENSQYRSSVKFDTLRNLEKDIYLTKLIPLIPKARIKGQLYVDFNNSCSKDSSIETFKLRRNISFGDYTGTTDNAGNFTVFVDTLPVSYNGKDSTLLKNCSLYAATQNIKLTIDSILDIGKIPTSPVFDLMCKQSVGRTRRGFDFKLLPIVANQSTSSVSNFISGKLPVLEIKYNPLLKFINSEKSYLSVDTANGIIRYRLSDILSGAQDSFPILFNVNANNFVRNDVLKFTMKLDSMGVDSNLLNNSSSITCIVTAAYDPNEKTLQNDSILTPADRFQYRIDFQNYGNDTAINVLVIDTLSSVLDVSTIEFNSSSAPCQFTVENRVLKAWFKNINLTDTFTNKEKSKGYFDFSILLKPKVIYPEVRNFAEIYFDFEKPIRTNTTLLKFKKEIELIAIKKDTLCYGDSLNIVIQNNSQNVFGSKFGLQWSDEKGNFGILKSVIVFPLSQSLVTQNFKIKQPVGAITSNKYRVRCIYMSDIGKAITDTSRDLLLEKLIPDFSIPKSEYCKNESITFNSGNHAEYMVKLNQTQWKINPNTSGFYLRNADLNDTVLNVNILGKYGCQETYNALLTVHPLPMISLQHDDSVCMNALTTMHVSAPNMVVWNWNTLSQNSLNKIDSMQLKITSTVNQFVFKVTDIFKCVSEKTINIHGKSLPKLRYSIEDTVCKNSPFHLTQLPTENTYKYQYGNVNISEFQPIQDITLHVQETLSSFQLFYKGENNCILDSNIAVPKIENRQLELEQVLPNKIEFCANEIKKYSYAFNKIKLTSRYFSDSFISPNSIKLQFPITTELSDTLMLRGTSNRNCIYAKAQIVLNVHSLPSKPQITSSNDSLYCAATELKKWYIWENNVWKNTGLTSNSILVQPWSFYKTVVTNSNNCTAESDSFFTGSLSLKKINFSQYYVVQNPTGHDELLLNLKVPATSLQLYDASGKMVLSKQNNLLGKQTLHLANTKPGIYYLVIQFTKGETETVKLLKEE